MIHITTDSCADLSQPLIDAHDLEVIPLHVMVKGEDHHDNDLTLQQLFSSVDDTGDLPKTAAPSVQEFMDFFNRDGDVVYVGLSSQLSATFQNANLAAEQLEKEDLHLIDSKNLSTGIGLLALKADDLRKAGKSAPEIAAEISTLRPQVQTAFVIDTMDYLYKGGRCSGLAAFVGSMLKIRPIISVRPDGSLGVKHKVRGSRTKALKTLLADFEADLPRIDLTRVFVTHTGCHQDADYLAQSLKALAAIKAVHITLAGATIASHCGPDTIGILYITEPNS
jgi:DegV family protein with EDD domain